MSDRIVRVSHLEEFIAEVPIGLVRLHATERIIPRKNSLPTKEVQLHLQGFNEEGELVWLMEGHDISWLPDGRAWTPRDQSIYDGMLKMRDHVRSHLEAHGYQVRGGSYALDKNVEPVRGAFECIKWHKNDDGTYAVVPLDQQEARRNGKPK